jgi:hypothetical protein
VDGQDEELGFTDTKCILLFHLGFCVLSLPLSTSGAYPGPSVVLMIVHLDGTPILPLHNTPPIPTFRKS